MLLLLLYITLADLAFCLRGRGRQADRWSNCPVGELMPEHKVEISRRCLVMGLMAASCCVSATHPKVCDQLTPPCVTREGKSLPFCQRWLDQWLFLLHLNYFSFSFGIYWFKLNDRILITLTPIDRECIALSDAIFRISWILTASNLPLKQL